jgi:outer membrane lipoprotein-sorting protein
MTTGAKGFQDDPSARRLFDGLVAVLHNVQSLAFDAESHCTVGGKEFRRRTYRLWMKKPNYARCEALESGESKGVLILDGEQFWVYWPNGRPLFSPGDVSKEEWARTHVNVYMSRPAPQGEHSIQHEIGWWLGVRSILEPSTFHGYGNPLDPYMDGVQALGVQVIDGEQCDGIEVSFMQHQRSWNLWLSRRDSLPRRLKEVVRTSPEYVIDSSWSNVTVNAAIPLWRFTWSPPADWNEWRPHSLKELLPKPGTPAPNFSLGGRDGETVALSEFRNKVVWLAFWRAG